MKNKFIKLLVIVGLVMPITSPAFAFPEPFVGQVMLFGGNFCPRGWTEANGQLLPIASYNALFSIYGTMYGGDGRTTFGMPDLRGRAAVSEGNGPGLQNYSQGAKGGAETHVLTTPQLPAHSFNYSVVIANGRPTTDKAAKVTGANNFISEAGIFRPSLDQGTTLIPGSTNVLGNNVAFNIRGPYQVLKYCVAVQGIFPSRN